MKILKTNFFKLLVLLPFVFLFSNNVSAQICGDSAILADYFCPKTDLSNYGVRSSNDAASLEYDNMISGFHATITRNGDGTFSIWGQKAGLNAAGTATTNILSPQYIDSSNYTGLSGIMLKATMGSKNGGADTDVHQFFALTTSGLYVWGTTGIVVSTGVSNQVGVKSISLPSGVGPDDVKMLFATYNSLVITTCGGDVHVLSQKGRNRGNGNDGDATTWYQVQTDSSTYLKDIIVARGTVNAMYALDKNGEIWTWGEDTYLGDNTSRTGRSYATKMTLPQVSEKDIEVKMIGATSRGDGTGNDLTYYVLSKTGSLYAMGRNANRSVGDFTTTERQSWVQCMYSTTTYTTTNCRDGDSCIRWNGNNSKCQEYEEICDTTWSYGKNMDDIAWISPNEHDIGVANSNSCASINVLNDKKELWAWGGSNGNMIGLGSGASNNPAKPNGTTGVDDIFLAVETGGHTSMVIKQCEANFGYVGHRVSGSMGNNSSADENETSYTYSTAPVDICGAGSKPDIFPKELFKFSKDDDDRCFETAYELESEVRGVTFEIKEDDDEIATLDTAGNRLTFSAPGTIKIKASVEGLCEALTEEKEFTVIKCKNTQPDFNSGYIKDTIKGSVATNDDIRWSPEPYEFGFNLVSSPAGSNPSFSLSKDGSYSFTGDKAGTYIYSITICNPGYDPLIDPPCPVEYLTIVITDPSSLDNPPIAGTDLATTKVNKAVTLKTLINDYPGSAGREIDKTSIKIVSAKLPADHADKGTLSVNASTGDITFTPETDFVGDITYYYEVCDDGGADNVVLCSEGMQKVTVNAKGVQNTTQAVDDYISGPKNTPITSNVMDNDFDPDGDVINVIKQAGTYKPGVGTFVLNDGTGGTTEGEFTFTPDYGFYGPTNFSYELCDNQNPKACDNATVYITIDNYHLEPDVHATTVNKAVSGNLATNDNLPAGFTYTFDSKVSGASGYTLSVSNNGTYTFSAPTVDVYKFKIKVCAGTRCYTEQLTINVTDPSNNNNPPNTNPDLAVMYGDDISPATITIDVLANDDISNIFGKGTAAITINELKAPKIDASGKSKEDGTISVSSKKIEYTPKAGFYGIDEFTYEACEDNTSPELCQEERVKVVVNKQGTTITTVGTDDYAYTFTNTPIDFGEFPSVLNNDISNSTTGTIKVTAQASKNYVGIGDFEIKEDGTYKFTPDPSFLGTASFPYMVCKEGVCANATLYIQVFDIEMLPIDLLDFSAEAFNRYVDLYWAALGEVNNNYYTIERSYDKSEWTFVGDVQGAGTTYSFTEYTLRDNTKPQSLVYYKLSQTDFDGLRRDLSIAKLQTDRDIVSSESITLFPNPCVNELTIKDLPLQNLQYEIYNVFGQLIQSGESGMEESISIDVSTLSQGTYFMRIIDKEQIKLRATFIKVD